MRKILLIVSCLMLMVFVEGGMTKNRIIVTGDPRIDLKYEKGEMLDVPLYARTVPGVTRVSQTIASKNIPSSYFLDLRGKRNVDTQSWDITADWLVLHDNSSPWQTVGISDISETNTPTTAGPIAGGRDQVAAFNTNDWIYFFIIYNPSTEKISSLSSLSATAPTLPTGYTYFVRVSSSLVGLALRSGRQIGNRIWPDDVVNTDHVGVAIVTALDISLAIPPTAKSVQGGFGPKENPAAARDAYVCSSAGVAAAPQRFHTTAAAYKMMYFDLPVVTAQTIYFYTETNDEDWRVSVYSYEDDL